MSYKIYYYYMKIYSRTGSLHTYNLIITDNDFEDDELNRDKEKAQRLMKLIPKRVKPVYIRCTGKELITMVTVSSMRTL